MEALSILKTPLKLFTIIHNSKLSHVLNLLVGLSIISFNIFLSLDHAGMNKTPIERSTVICFRWQTNSDDASNAQGKTIFLLNFLFGYDRGKYLAEQYIVCNFILPLFSNSEQNLSTFLTKGTTNFE